ncbi:hypothetical protein MRBL20_001054 [Peribacillus frigoritolerans]
MTLESKIVSVDFKNKGGIAMWGKYLWKLRLLLFSPIVFYAIFMYSSFDSDEGFPSSYFLILAIYTLITSIILHKMEKKEKKEKE